MPAMDANPTERPAAGSSDTPAGSGTGAAPNRMPLNGRLGRLLMIVGGLAFVVLLSQIVRWPASLGIANPQTWTEYFVIFAACVVGLIATYALPMLLRYVGFALHYHALRKQAANASDVLSRDPRPPVLYFRSFEDDIRQRKFVATLNAAPALMLEQSAEEVLVEYLQHIGPLVAIGRPGEALPEVGFARMYVDHTEWQASVIRLLEGAALIVLRAGHSAGVLWESAQIFTRVPLHKVVVLVPAAEQFDYGMYRDQVQRMSGIILPELPRSSIKRFPLRVQAIVRFDPSGEPCLAVLPEPGLPPKSWINRLPDWYYRRMARIGIPWFRPETVDFGSLVVKALHPAFAQHALAFDDPAVRYDQRMQPTRFDRTLRWFAIAVCVVVAALFVFGCVMLFVYGTP